MKLADEYEVSAREKRRAIHELELSTIELRAAETRRMVADAQLEKARQGVLGIDAEKSNTDPT